MKFKKIYEIENFFDNPDFVLSKMSSSNYYSKENFQLDVCLYPDNNLPEGHWRGFRSKDLHFFEAELKSSIERKLLSIIFNNYSSLNFNCYFHLAPECIEINESSWHVDHVRGFAGVIYMSKEPPSDSGTKIFTSPNPFDLKLVENKYNKLLLYKSNLTHSPMKCFGSNFDTVRKTVTIFINLPVKDFISF